MRLPIICAILSLSSLSHACANYTYALDDGTAEQVRGSGPTPGYSIFQANQFTANPAGNLITSISIAFGSPLQPGYSLVGTPVTYFLFRDANGLATPDDPVLLASVATTIQNPDKNSFVTAVITPTLVTGNFFVGCVISNLPAAGEFPLAFDTTTPQDRSFGAGYSTNVGLNQLSSIHYDPNGTFQTNSNTFSTAYDGNFLFRANGIPATVPEPSSIILLGIGTLALSLHVVRTRSRSHCLASIEH